MTTRLAILFLVFIGAMAIGCGESGPPRVPVKGKITYAGGDWPKPALLDFVMLEPAEGMPNQTTSTEIKPDGNFDVQLIPGEYAINITCWEVEMKPDNPQSGKSYIPDAYLRGDKRPKISVPLGTKTPITVNFDIPKS
jgi:hypothetical protein